MGKPEIAAWVAKTAPLANGCRVSDSEGGIWAEGKPGSRGLGALKPRQDVLKDIEKLRNGEKLISPTAYCSLFWDQFNVKACSFCISAKKEALSHCPLTPADRVTLKNIERGKCLGKCSGREKKIQWIKALASVKFSAPEFIHRHEKRKSFNEHWSLKGISGQQCFVCGEPAHHRHHLIQLQHGGLNTQRNHVPLCRSCHSEVHKP